MPTWSQQRAQEQACWSLKLSVSTPSRVTECVSAVFSFPRTLTTHRYRFLVHYTPLTYSLANNSRIATLLNATVNVRMYSSGSFPNRNANISSNERRHLRVCLFSFTEQMSENCLIGYLSWMDCILTVILFPLVFYLANEFSRTSFLYEQSLMQVSSFLHYSSGATAANVITLSTFQIDTNQK